MEMMRLVPKGSCPRCGHRQFIIKEIQSNLYLTGRDGEIIDSKEEKYVAVGKCTNCGREYDMAPGYNTFIPLTPIRKFLYEYSTPELVEAQPRDMEYIPNPFWKK